VIHRLSAALHCGNCRSRVCSPGHDGNYVCIPNDWRSSIPEDFLEKQQIVLESQTLDTFANWHARDLVKQIPPPAEFCVSGGVAEYCVRFAAKGLLQRGRRVSRVSDAIETLLLHAGNETLPELKSLAATIVTADQMPARVHAGDGSIHRPVLNRFIIFAKSLDSFPH
jgi:nicotinamidase-related amidase